MKEDNYWVYEVLPSGNYLNKFRTLKNYNYSIVEDTLAMPLNFVLSSKHFVNKTDPKDVYQIAMFIVGLLNGTGNLIHKDNDDCLKISLGKLYKDGEVQNERSSVKNVDYLNIDHLFFYPEGIEKYTFNGIVNLGFKNGFIRNILLHCMDKWDLNTMYKLSDEISCFLKEQNDDIKKYVNRKRYNLFGSTANNFSVSGLQARHGKSANATPSKSMSIDEASDFIRELLNKVLRTHFKIELNYFEEDKIDSADLFK